MRMALSAIIDLIDKFERAKVEWATRMYRRAHINSYSSEEKINILLKCPFSPMKSCEILLKLDVVREKLLRLKLAVEQLSQDLNFDDY